MNASWASGSDFGCCGRTDSRRKPSAASCLADAAFVQHDAEFCLDAVLQVTATPAHHAVPNRVGTGLDRRRQARPAARVPAAGGGAAPSGSPARRGPRHCSGARSSGKLSPGQFPDPPHPAASGGPSRRSAPPLCGRSPSPLEPMARRWLIQHQRNRQHPPRRTRVLRLARSRAKLRRRQFPPRDRNPCHACLLSFRWH